MLFEAGCPKCEEVFPVAETARTATCPRCGLGIDLVTEEEAALADAGLVESPCPACSAPLLIAPEDEAGLCAHCEARLEFRSGRAFRMNGARVSPPDRPYAPLVVCRRPTGRARDPPRTREGAP